MRRDLTLRVHDCGSDHFLLFFVVSAMSGGIIGRAVTIMFF